MVTLLTRITFFTLNIAHHESRALTYYSSLAQNKFFFIKTGFPRRCVLIDLKQASIYKFIGKDLQGNLGYGLNLRLDRVGLRQLSHG